MNIITRRGDDGFTDVMYGGRVPKIAPEVVACGAVDELTSCLGMVRVSGIPDEMTGKIDTIQGHLVTLMGLLSVPGEKRDQYLADGYPDIGQGEIDWLDDIGENITVKIDGWARPGQQAIWERHGWIWLAVFADALSWQLGHWVMVCRWKSASISTDYRISSGFGHASWAKRCDGR